MSEISKYPDPFSKNPQDFSALGGVGAIISSFILMIIPALIVRAIWDGDVGYGFWIVSSILTSLIFPVVRFFYLASAIFVVVGGGLFWIIIYLVEAGN